MLGNYETIFKDNLLGGLFVVLKCREVKFGIVILWFFCFVKILLFLKLKVLFILIGDYIYFFSNCILFCKDII